MSSQRRRLRRSARRRTDHESGDRVAATGARRAGDGRVHLSLLVDQASGHERLTLAEPVFREQWQDQLAIAAANTAFAIFRKRAGEGVVELARQAMDSTSKLVLGLLEQAPPGSLACREGCDHCCRQSVGVTPPELFAIVAHLASTRTSSELSTLRVQVAELAARTRGLSSRQRARTDLPCPLLDQGKCSVYEFRPLSCRGMNSLDARICEQKLHDGPIRDAFFAGTLEGHVFVEPIRAFHAISAGLQLALSECFGLDMRPLDLTAALHLVLSRQLPLPSGAKKARPTASEDAGWAQLLAEWLKGEPSLSAARGGDASAQAGQRELAGVASPPPGARKI